MFDFANGLTIPPIRRDRGLGPDPPHFAVAWAAFFNFIAFMVFGLHVAETVGKGIVDANIVDASVIFGALVGAIAWNVITWILGIPSSSSHALIGGLLGAGVTKAGVGAVVWSGVIKTTIGIFFAPILGMAVALLLMVMVAWLFKGWNANRAERTFRRTQLFTSALYSLGHGSNDAQRRWGDRGSALFAGTARQQLPRAVLGDPLVPGGVGLGTLMGGWRIVKTMGSKITACRRSRACAPKAGGSIMLFGATCWASRCRPPTPSPARSWASARRRRPRRCGGVSPAASSSPGSSPSHASAAIAAR